jgi:hypothetical protein
MGKKLVVDHRRLVAVTEYRMPAPALGLTHGSKEALLFEKKKQKLLQFEAPVRSNAHPNEQKFFGSFSQKRTACLYLT